MILNRRMVREGNAVGRGGSEDKKGCRNGESSHWRDLQGDYGNIALLLLLYTLQGVPMGLGASIPLLLQERGASFAQQSVFSLVSWPFSLKLLWAPIVDSCYSERFIWVYRSWKSPTRVSLAAALKAEPFTTEPFTIPDTFDEYLGSGSSPPHVLPLSVGFFGLYLLMATQDIAVDGWALTMLSKRNVSWASTCNTTGQTVGYSAAFIGFMALNSPVFCNAWLRSPFGYDSTDSGAVSLGGFTKFWGWLFLVTTIGVGLFKRESPSVGTAVRKTRGVAAGRDRGDAPTAYHEVPTLASEGSDHGVVAGCSQNWEADESVGEEVQLSLAQTYWAMVGVLKLRPVLMLVALLVTGKVAFAAADAAGPLKLQQRGVPKETLAILGVATTPISIFLPAAIAKYTRGPSALNSYIAAVPPRLVISAGASLLITSLGSGQNFTQASDLVKGNPVEEVYGRKDGAGMGLGSTMVLFVCFALHAAVGQLMFVAQMAFFARVSDPLIGGSYMTLLNTLANLGSKWPQTLVLALIDPLTTGYIDGFHVLNAICVFFGICWFFLVRKSVASLNALPLSAWAAKIESRPLEHSIV